MRYGNGSGCFQLARGGQIEFSMAKEHGFDCIDYDLCYTGSAFYKLPEEELLSFVAAEKARADEVGVEIFQVHGPWPTNDKTEEERAEKLVFMKRSVLCTALLGAKNFVLHPVMPHGYGPEPEGDTLAYDLTKELLIQLAEYAKPLGVNICLENMPFAGHRLSTVKSIAELVEDVNLDNVKICLDTGHAFIHKEDGEAMVRNCGKNLACLHIHDNYGSYDFHSFPFTRGSINWSAFTKALKDIGYQGALVFETNIAPETPLCLRGKLLDVLRATAEVLDPDNL